MPRKTPGYNAGGVVELFADYDFSLPGNSVLTTAVAEVLAIPAGTKVLAVITEVLKPSENLDDFNVGDGSDPNGYIDAADGTAVEGTCVIGEFVTVLSKLYTSADTIDIENATAETVSTGKIRVSAICITK